jgi:hypothetical protein
LDIKFVKRSSIKATKKRASKFRPLLEAIERLKPGGQALEVSFSTEKGVNSMRTAVYQFCRKKNITVKSRRDSANKKIYFYMDK